MSFYNSLETLIIINKWLIVIGIIIGGLFAVGLGIIQTRITELSADRNKSSEDIIKDLTGKLSAVEEKTADRRITKEQKEQFISFLKDKPKLKFDLFNAGNNEESLAYSEQIFRLLIDAGYKNIGGISTSISAPTPKNILIGIRSEKLIEVITLLNALNLINIKYNIIENLQIPTDQVNIFIGAKGL